MTAVKNFTMNMSGVVAESNNVVSSFGVWFDSQAKALLVGSDEAFISVFGTKSAVITELLNKLLPTVMSFVFPTTTKVVKSFTLTMTGVVAYEDNTVSPFSFEIRDDDTVTEHIAGSNMVYDSLMRDPAAKAIILEMFEDLVDTTVTAMSESGDPDDDSSSSESASSVSSATSDTSESTP